MKYNTVVVNLFNDNVALFNIKHVKYVENPPTLL